MEEPVIPEDALRKQAWDYFAMHSNQRLTTFNFYIIISSVIMSALFTTLQDNYQVPRVGLALGVLLSFFSFIFWTVDNRNKQSRIQVVSATSDCLKNTSFGVL